MRRRETVAADHAGVAYLGKVPGLGNLSTGVIVNMLVGAVHDRQLYADAPVRIEGVVEFGDVVAVDGADFVVMAGNLADPHILGAGARLILIDEFMAQVESSARFGPCPLRAPVGIQRTECRSAARARVGCGC